MHLKWRNNMHVCTNISWNTHKERLREREREADKANLEKAKYTVGNRGSKGWINKKHDAAAKSHVSYTNLMLFLYTKKNNLYISDKCSF
jgi:hypothetical protein